KLKKDVRDFVEKYFLDTPERPKSLDTSTFLEGGGSMSKKGRQNKVSQEVANPTVSKTEAEMAKDSVDTAKQAKKNRS
ncbi:hypothetical protein CV945_14300, partial [Geobacillus sp. Manikaran-105]